MQRRNATIAEVLAQVKLFADMPADELQRIASAGQRRTYHRREALYRTGDPSDRIHVIEDGYVKLVVETYTGDQRIIDILGPGHCFGELGLVDGAPRRWLVRALGTVTTVSVPRERLHQIMHAHPKLVDQALIVYRSRISALIELLADSTFLSVRERLARRVLDLTGRYGRHESDAIELHVPLVQEDLAALVGATRSSVNTCLRQLEEQGVLARRPRHLAILSIEGLEAAAAMPQSLRKAHDPKPGVGHQAFKLRAQ